MEDGITKDVDDFKFCVETGDYGRALEIAGKYLKNIVPFRNKLGVRDVVDLYVGLRHEGKDDEAYTFAGIVDIPDGVLTKEVLNEFFYKSFVKG